MSAKHTRSERITAGSNSVPFMTQGTVVDTNDPQQMGRVRVRCPKWGDTGDAPLTSVPWAQYCTPFGGVAPTMSRGPENSRGCGSIGYGMWMIPKVGSQVIVFCLDGDPTHRVYLGSVFGDFTSHTLPLGRYDLTDPSDDLDSDEDDVPIYGPVNSREKQIEPLFSNMRTAFGSPSGNFEWDTRAVEIQAAAYGTNVLDQIVSGLPDNENIHGYPTSRSRGDVVFTNTGGNIDPQKYFITTPGLHSFIMDDSIQNGRIRIRSTSGNQIILDDTNERIYVSTAAGNNWIEMDKNGNIDIYSSRRISIHADKDLNLTAGESIRLSSDNIHLRAKTDIRAEADKCIGIYATEALEIYSGTTMGVQSGSDMKLESGGEFDLLSAESIYISATGGGGNMGDVHIRASQDTSVPGNIWILAEPVVGGQMGFDASLIQYNNGSAAAFNIAASSAGVPSNKHAYTTNRVPLHEPWGRIMIKQDVSDVDGSSTAISDVLAVTRDSSVLELSYNDSNVGLTELGESITRNVRWRR